MEAHGFSKLHTNHNGHVDLIDIQKGKHANVNTFSYRSKALKMKSRIDFFLVANHIRKYVHKANIQSSIAPDHNLDCVLLQWENEITRGPGFWKFNNSLLKDEMKFPPTNTQFVSCIPKEIQRCK